MGTSLELRVRADDIGIASRAEQMVLAEIDRLAAIVSTYEPTSELSRWRSAGPGAAPQRLSAELHDLLATSDEWTNATGGAFDPRVEAVIQLWKVASSAPPSDAQVQAALRRMKPPAWRLDPKTKTAELLTDCPITLDAIAKGEIVGRACDAAFDGVPGLHGLLLNVGGDLRARGNETWRIGVASPSQDSETSAPLCLIEINDVAVATSGRSQRGFTVGGRRESHILDPRTGLPARSIDGATVIAPRSIDADALATACNVLDPAASIKLAESIPGVECLIVESNGRIHQSKGWARYEAVAFASAREVALPAAEEKAAEPATWGVDHEVVVEFEIVKPATEQGRYRRPYIAVWVEDKDGQPVRTLALWVSQGGAGPFQWLPDLRRWFAADQERKKFDKTDMVLTISRPTRPPGKYSVIWDGKDNKKKPLGPGQYTLCIDSAREHGTSESIRQEINVGGDTFRVTAEGNAEVSSAAFEYRVKAVKK
ncbi:DUF2271 domain-containing protein [Isosphaeraceae bacterium EP7]